MRHIDEDSVTQAVIARHAAAPDPRVRELMTSLVQHLHAFAREVRLTEDEWAAGLRALADAGARGEAPAPALKLLSDVLGLTTLVVAMNQRRPRDCTPATAASRAGEDLAAAPGAATPGARAALSCYLLGRVRGATGASVAGAEVTAWPADCGQPVHTHTDTHGRFVLHTRAQEAEPLPPDGPAGRLLPALGRSGWRPARLRCRVQAPGYRTLHTELFRQGDRHLDNDAVFGVRSALIVDWQAHDAGPAPDGGVSAAPFHTVDYDFVLDPEPTA